MDEGKTQVSTNLACAIASSGKKVLIVDTDMRRRCIAGLLGIHTECGLYSVLVGQAPLKSAIYPTDRPNLYFMDSEPNIPSPPDVLSTKRFSALVDTLREMFDYVIFDSPPIGLFVDAAIISNLVDGTLYVIRERAAKRDDVVAGVQQLKAANARILGSVITFSREETNSDYYYAYYNSEGKRVSRKDREAQLAENPNARDLAAEDIGQWARKAGIDPNQAERRTNGERPRRQNPGQPQGSSASMGAGMGAGTAPSATPNAGAGAGVIPQRAARANADEQFPRGAFKPAVPRSANGRAPRHKNTRI